MKNKEQQKIGLIAGNGTLPKSVIKACQEQGIPLFVIGLKGHADSNLLSGVSGAFVRLGSIGKIVRLLKKNNVKKIIFIGGVRRPSIPEIMPDLTAFSLLVKVGFKLLGDNQLLEIILNEAEKLGFQVVGADSIVPELIAPEGIYGKIKPDSKDTADIMRGIQVAKTLGQVDVGQAVIVQHGLVLSVEGIEGTASLIKRTADLKRKGGGGVLIKVSKPQQDKRVDLPTIGPATVQSVFDAGFKGIAVEAGSSLLAEPEKMVALADKLGIFVMGVKGKKLNL